MFETGIFNVVEEEEASAWDEVQYGDVARTVQASWQIVDKEATFTKKLSWHVKPSDIFHTTSRYHQQHTDFERRYKGFCACLECYSHRNERYYGLRSVEGAMVRH